METPEHIKKYRKSFNEEPGIRQQHYGLVNDPKPSSNFVYGKPTAVSDHVENTIKSAPLSKLAEYANELRESKYASHKREPLGQVMPRNYALPPAATAKGFSYGVPTAASTLPKGNACR